MVSAKSEKNWKDSVRSTTALPPLRLWLLLVLPILTSCTRATGPYPSKPVKVYVGFAPGGGTDVIARTVASLAPRHLGQRMIVVNLPGAAGTRAGKFVSRSQADGYALLIAGGSESVSVGHFKDLPYDPVSAFTPIIRMTRERIVLSIRADRQWKDFNDFVRDARAHPNKYTYSTAGYASIYHAAMLAICRSAGIQLRHLPCSGSGPSMAALLGGHVDLALSAPTETVALEKAGKIRCLAITSAERTDFHPDVPTLVELGYPVVLENQKGFVAPEGLPQDRLQVLLKALTEIYESEEFLDLCAKQRIEPAFLGPDEFAQSLKSMSETIGEVLEQPENSSGPVPARAPSAATEPSTTHSTKHWWQPARTGRAGSVLISGGGPSASI